jgi:hypothetical protein
MAAFNAIALMSTNPWSTRPSIFVIKSSPVCFLAKGGGKARPIGGPRSAQFPTCC